MKILLVIISLTAILAGGSNTKYIIYFKDKGLSAGTLQKQSAEYLAALNRLSPAAIERRKQVMGDDNIITEEDIPVSRVYTDSIENAGISIIHRLDWFNAVSAYLNPEQLTYIQALPFVAKVEKVKSFSSAGDELSPAQTSTRLSKSVLNYGESFTQLQMNKIPDVHKKGITGRGVLVGVLDSGFDWQVHDALKTRNVISEYDFVFGDSVTANQAGDVPGQHGHGTFVFSVIGGFKDSMLFGAAYGADFLLAKTEDIRSERNIEEDNYAAALQWMENRGVKITSSSLGYNEFDAGQTSYTYAQMDGKTTIVTRAAELAFSRGVLTITAAGNEGNKSWKYIIAPGDGIYTTTIGAVGSDDSVASFSGIGPTPDGRLKPELVAMGLGVYGATASSMDRYQYGTGTSAATPIAAGTAALVWSAYPHLTNAQVKARLIRTAGSFNRPNFYRGYGLINVKEAISLPAVKNTPGGYIFEKVFFDSVAAGTAPKLFFSKNNTEFDSVTMVFDGGFKYQASLPVTDGAMSLYFYIRHESAPGTIVRTPAAGSYFSSAIGSQDIVLETTPAPGGYVLENNYPNPFNNLTSFRFYSPIVSTGRLVIYNALGEQIKMLYNGDFKLGYSTFTWDGKNDKGDRMPGGVYFYSVIYAGNQLTQKMVYLP